MRTHDAYIQSLRERGLTLWVNGERLTDPVDHPLVRPAVNAVAQTYALAEEEEFRDLATARSEFTGERVNRFTHIFRDRADLVAKLMLQRELGRRTGTCFQRCVGMDGLNALFIATYAASDPIYHQRFLRWLEQVQRDDDVICGAMTDAKGNRMLRPAQQPDQFLRVVERTDDGIVIRGVKLHQTGAANAHQVLVMPGTRLREGEEDFAVAAAMPVNAPGLSMILGRQPSDTRKGTADAGNHLYGGQECVVVFDDVFIPSERVFLDGDTDTAGALLTTFAGYHRASYGGCKPGNLDVLIGAVAQLVKEIGVDRASHVRTKLVEMAHLTETIHGVGLAASHTSTLDPSGVYTVDPILANVCKQNVTRLPYEIVRLAEDLAGGSMSTLPSLEDLDHPEIGPTLQLVAGSPARARLLRLVEWMCYGSGSVPLRIECMHGAGSPKAQQIVIERAYDWDARMTAARRLAGLEE